MIFYDKGHEVFFIETMNKVRYRDVYHTALCYTLGISRSAREHIDSIYDFKTGDVKPDCIYEGWQTSGSIRVVRLAFNLYCNGTPTTDNEQNTSNEDKIRECSNYAVDEIFCCGYAPYFWQAIQIRYPEYCEQ